MRSHLSNLLGNIKKSKFYQKIIRKFSQKKKNKVLTRLDSSILYQRLYVVIIVFAIVFSLLALKLIIVSTSDKASISKYFAPELVSRNEIVDRNGALLAVDLSIVSLYAQPRLILDPDSTANELVRIFPELKKKDLINLLDNNKNFAWIRRNITPKQQHQVNSLGIPGLEFEKAIKRIYPQGNLFSHILGYVDTDGIGIAGIEKQFDKYLRNPKNGKLELSVDVRIQNIVHDEMLKSIEEFNAKGGVGIIMDANNGEIISVVSLPDFDPHYPGSASPEQLFNQFSLGVYEVGSIMKGLTIAMGLETKAVSLNDVYHVKAPIKAARFTIHDYRPKRSYLSIPQVFMHSSNIGTAMVSIEVGGETQRQYLKRWGMFDPIKIELPEKGQAMYPSDREWGEISTMTISFGHGMAVTPLHFIRAAVSLINGGYTLEPSLLKKNNKEDVLMTRVISEETSETMRKLMRLTVEHGSGKKANAKGYYVGGKTGSAEKAIRGGYSKKAKYAAFLGAFPMNNPRYVTLMVLDDPRPNKTSPFSGGAWSAAPLTGRIISRIAPVLNVEPVDSEDPDLKKRFHLEFDPDAEMKEQTI